MYKEDRLNPRGIAMMPPYPEKKFHVPTPLALKKIAGVPLRAEKNYFMWGRGSFIRAVPVIAF